LHEDFERLGPLYMSADRVVAMGLRAFDRGEVICVPGLVNLASAMSVRMYPRYLVQWMLEPMFRAESAGPVEGDSRPRATGAESLERIVVTTPAEEMP